ncbi:hypothetical protein NA32_10060, partial [Streptococcus hongkongensis]
LVKEQAADIATWYNRKSFAVMATDSQVETYSRRADADAGASFPAVGAALPLVDAGRGDETSRSGRSLNTRRLSSCSVVGCIRSPQSLT